MKDLQLISYIIKTLGDIEVKGKDNISKLLGCINALESILKVEEIQQKKDSEVTDNG